MTDEMNMKPPPRLVDDPAVAPELREGLSEMAATQLPFDTAAGLSSLQGALGSAAQLNAAAAAPAIGSAVSTGALVAGGVALMLAGAGVYTWLAPNAKAPRKAEPSPKAAPVAPAPRPIATPPVAAPELATPEPALVPAPIEEEARASAPTPLDREVAAMVKAKALVDSKPRAALVLLQRIEREHPRGTLSEERTGLRVLALWAAGEHEAALDARAMFLARYPQSPMRERLMQLEAP